MVASNTTWAVEALETSGLPKTDLKELKLLLDKRTTQFGLVYTSDFGAEEVVLYEDDDQPVFFSAQNVISAAHCLAISTSKKVSLLLPDRQLNVIFETQEIAFNFLEKLKELATKSYTIHSLSNNVKKFTRADFNMRKHGYVGNGTTNWSAVSDPVTSGFHRLWRTGDYSDFIVATDEEEFKVHRSVLCPQSAFFEAACRPSLLEAASGKIKLEEDAKTVETILCECYGVENTMMGSVFTNFALKLGMEMELTVETLLKVFIACDKYTMNSIAVKAVEALEARIHFIRDPFILVHMARSIFAQCPTKDAGLRAIILTHVKARLPHILADEYAWQALLEDSELLKKIVTILIAGNTDVTDASVASVLLMTPPTSPIQTRKSPRSHVPSRFFDNSP